MEQAAGLGLPGDMILVDLSQYIHCSKGTILTAMTSISKFDYDEIGFPLDLADGRLAAPGPPRSRRTRPTSRKTYSFVVVLAAR